MPPIEIIPSLFDSYSPLEYTLREAQRIMREGQEKARKKIRNFDQRWATVTAGEAIVLLGGDQLQDSSWRMIGLNAEGRRVAVILPPERENV